MKGLMQDWPLTLDRIIDHAASWHGETHIVGRNADRTVSRTTYGALQSRARQLSVALHAMGMQPGDRIATLAWNTPDHMALWYGTVGMGAICHTLNPRHSIDQLTYIINHAQDRVIFVDVSFFPLLRDNLARIPSVERLIILGCREHPADTDCVGALWLDELVAGQSEDCQWGDFPEDTASNLCYTSGTSGMPKGVLYSHRSNFLHALVSIMPDMFALSARDVVLPLVPMFHANAWGLVFSCPAVGAKIVMPGPFLDASAIHELIETEGVTFSAAVPTVWQTLLAHLRETGQRLTTLKRIVIAGSAVSEAMIRTFQEDYGIDVMHAWGMTEVSPLGTLASPRGSYVIPRDQSLSFKIRQGRVPVGLEMKIVDDAGNRLAHDDAAVGHLMIKGPYVAQAYFNHDAGDLLDAEGYFDTGDISRIDADGYMQIVDRAKDLIKSGGEWISSVELENIAADHPDAALTAVVGIPHPKWDERPVLFVKLKDGSAITEQELRAFLTDKMPRWWLPDEIHFREDLPLGATGKIDKNALRQQLASVGRNPQE